MNSSFDDIRPYYDSELPEAMQRIVNNPLFGVVASYVFPELDVDVVREKMLAVRSIHDFQYEIMYYVNRRIIQNTITGLSVNGIENIRKNCGHLYISNHRDIMLDASLMQNIMMDNELPTTQITFGANLMKDEIVIDIGKSNKMFRVERP
ncbi:MAG: 1-acyl-sn-glycerol-3-phosphate acyltransferase, partial [Alistipes sp.]|nr:1-acyl-sn-glycerol-3-phosphate acyltransferase [Alistipes sp.]